MTMTRKEPRLHEKERIYINDPGLGGKHRKYVFCSSCGKVYPIGKQKGFFYITVKGLKDEKFRERWRGSKLKFPDDYNLDHRVRFVCEHCDLYCYSGPDNNNIDEICPICGNYFENCFCGNNSCPYCGENFCDGDCLEE